MGLHEPYLIWLEGYFHYFLEYKEDELVWRVLHSDGDIAYGAAYFLAWKYDLQRLFF